MEFDYVIVGAGSAGCVLAHRLSEDPRNRVALLEAGGRDKNMWIHIPVGFAKTLNDPTVNWLFYTEPDEKTRNRPIPIPRGKVLGGSSSINGMLYVRGHPRDYDTWAQLGNRGWSYDDVLPTSSVRRTTRGARTSITGSAVPSPSPSRCRPISSATRSSKRPRSAAIPTTRT